MLLRERARVASAAVDNRNSLLTYCNNTLQFYGVFFTYSSPNSVLKWVNYSLILD